MFQRTSETFRGHSESAGRASFDMPLNRLSACAFADVAVNFDNPLPPAHVTQPSFGSEHEQTVSTRRACPSFWQIQIFARASSFSPMVFRPPQQEKSFFSLLSFVVGVVVQHCCCCCCCCNPFVILIFCLIFQLPCLCKTNSMSNLISFLLPG